IAFENGEIKPGLDAEVFAKHLESLLKGVSVFYTTGHRMDTLPDTFNQIIDQLFNLIEIKNHERIQISGQKNSY
ncbi:MAG TPA: hypothetical protein VI583_09705, partial [Cyclobacteriaceae bacterium]|nr:hypothetical protein [Cyclobacteriaceae bacterium]